MNSTSDVHPKGDCKSPLLGLPPASELFAQSEARGFHPKNHAPEHKIEK
jgi:hypothetical protein